MKAKLHGGLRTQRNCGQPCFKMKEYITSIELDGEILVDVDASGNDFYLGITDKGNEVVPFDLLNKKQTKKSITTTLCILVFRINSFAAATNRY